MPSLTFTLSAAAATELTDAFGQNYQAVIDGQPNPETKTQYARKQVAVLIKREVLDYRTRQAAKTKDATDPDIT